MTLLLQTYIRYDFVIRREAKWTQLSFLCFIHLKVLEKGPENSVNNRGDL